jgi:hypothetical protein
MPTYERAPGGTRIATLDAAEMPIMSDSAIPATIT